MKKRKEEREEDETTFMNILLLLFSFFLSFFCLPLDSNGWKWLVNWEKYKKVWHRSEGRGLFHWKKGGDLYSNGVTVTVRRKKRRVCGSTCHSFILSFGGKPSFFRLACKHFFSPSSSSFHPLLCHSKVTFEDSSSNPVFKASVTNTQTVKPVSTTQKRRDQKLQLINSLLFNSSTNSLPFNSSTNSLPFNSSINFSVQFIN